MISFKNRIIFLPILKTFSFFIMMSFVTVQYAHAKTGICHGAYSGERSFFISLPMADGENISPSFHPLLRSLAKNPEFTIQFNRCLANQITKHKRLQNGFIFTASQHYNKVFIQLSLPPMGTSATDQTISLLKPYHPDNALNQKIQSLLKDDPSLKKGHALQFKSDDENTVILAPVKGYVTLYDFAKTASNKELIAFWKRVYEVSKGLRAQGQSYTLISRAGSAAGQKEPHFHIRFELVDKD